MSVSILTSASDEDAKCTICHQPIANGMAVVVLLTEVWKAVLPNEDHDIKPGDTVVSLDWHKQDLAHAGCMNSALEMARDKG